MGDTQHPRCCSMRFSRYICWSCILLFWLCRQMSGNIWCLCMGIWLVWFRGMSNHHHHHQHICNANILLVSFTSMHSPEPSWRDTSPTSSANSHAVGPWCVPGATRPTTIDTRMSRSRIRELCRLNTLFRTMKTSIVWMSVDHCWLMRKMRRRRMGFWGDIQRRRLWRWGGRRSR